MMRSCEKPIRQYRVRTSTEKRAYCRPSQASRLRSEEHTSELQSLAYLVCRLLLEKNNTPVVRIFLHRAGVTRLVPGPCVEHGAACIVCHAHLDAERLVLRRRLPAASPPVALAAAS